MNADTPRSHSDAANEAIRQLNHATLNAQSAGVDDVYAVVGALREMATRLDQTVRQLVGILEARLAAGGLTVDEGTPNDGDPAAAVAAAGDQLARAQDAARQLSARLSEAHNLIAPLADANVDA